MAKNRSNIVPATGSMSGNSQPDAIRIIVNPETMKPLWTDLITLTGMTTTVFQKNFREGMMIVEERRWCIPCEKVCYRVGAAMFAPDPFGETHAMGFDATRYDIGIF